MNTLLVSYDLINPGRNYQPLYDYFKSFVIETKPLQTVYLLHTAKSAIQVRDDLKALVDSNDKVLVIAIDTSHWATYNLPNTSAWLNNR